jgi:transcriptional regulator with XRE-family HTH domain
LTIGERVRERRKALHLSQEDIARRAGVSLNQINRLERGEIESPRFTTMVHLAHSLGMRVGDFVEEEEPTGPPLVA